MAVAELPALDEIEVGSVYEWSESRQAGFCEMVQAAFRLPVTPTPKQAQLLLTRNRTMRQPIFWGGGMGGGKALSNGTLCSTPFGWKAIESFRPGDQIHAADGTVARVLGVWPQGVTRRMRVTFSDGASVVTNPDHLWLASEAMKTYRADRRWMDIDGPGSPVRGRIYTTEELKAATERANVRRRKHGGGKGGSVLIPVGQEVQYTIPPRRSGQLRIDPYTLGVLLGDGSLSPGGVTFTSADTAIIQRVEAAGHDLAVSQRGNHSIGRFRRPKKTIEPHLTFYGLLGHRSWEKFIPSDYKYGSIYQRWEILRGLMDTDGTVDRSGKISFTTVSRQLAEDVCHLVESLGGTATRSERVGRSYLDGVAKDCRIAYTLRIKFRDCAQAFHLERKRSRAGAPQALYRRVVSVEEIEEGETTCVTIDHPSGLFLATERFIATHNSFGLCLFLIAQSYLVQDNRSLLCRKEFSALSASTLQEMIRLTEMCPDVKWWPGKHIFEFRSTGSEIWYNGVGTARQIAKLGSTQFGTIGIDEAPELERPIFKMLQTRLRHKPAADANRLYLLLTGNPYPGWIREEFVYNRRPGYQFIPALASDNPHLYEGYVSDMTAEMDEDWVRAMVGGDWDAFSNPDQAIPESLIRAAQQRFRDYQWTVDWSDHTWGIDVARKGKDWTEICGRVGEVWDRIDGWDEPLTLEQQADRIVQRWSELPPNHKPQRICIDDVGVGGGLTDALTRRSWNGELGETLIVPVLGGGTSGVRDPMHYASVNAELIYTVRAILASGRGAIYDDTGQRGHHIGDELGAINGLFRGARRVVDPNPVVSQRIGHSPDRANALCYTVYREKQVDFVPSYGRNVTDADDEVERQRLLAYERQQIDFRRAADVLAGRSSDDVGY